MEKMKDVGEIKHEKSGKRVIVTEEDVDDIMCSALEGGVVYWCNAAKVPADKMVASGNAILLLRMDSSSISSRAASFGVE